MKNTPLPIPVVDENDPPVANDGATTPPPPELLRSFVYREPTGLPSEDDDSHPRRRHSDRVPQK